MGHARAYFIPPALAVSRGSRSDRSASGEECGRLGGFFNVCSTAALAEEVEEESVAAQAGTTVFGVSFLIKKKTLPRIILIQSVFSPIVRVFPKPHNVQEKTQWIYSIA